MVEQVKTTLTDVEKREMARKDYFAGQLPAACTLSSRSKGYMTGGPFLSSETHALFCRSWCFRLNIHSNELFRLICAQFLCTCDSVIFRINPHSSRNSR